MIYVHASTDRTVSPQLYIVRTNIRDPWTGRSKTKVMMMHACMVPHRTADISIDRRDVSSYVVVVVIR